MSDGREEIGNAIIAGIASDDNAVGQMIAWCERDRVPDTAEVRARLKAWIPEYAPPAGAPVKPIPAEARVGEETKAPLPLRALRKR